MISCIAYSALQNGVQVVDRVREETDENRTTYSIQRFIANNYFQGWYTSEYVQQNNVDLLLYQHLPLYSESITLKFPNHLETLYLKFQDDWFIYNTANVICNNKAFVTLSIRNGDAIAKVYLIIEHSGNLREIF